MRRACGSQRPTYVRVLALQRLRPGALACFALFEGVVAVALLLALAELASWTIVFVLPVVVAGGVKVADAVMVVRGGQPVPPQNGTDLASEHLEPVVVSREASPDEVAIPPCTMAPESRAASGHPVCRDAWSDVDLVPDRLPGGSGGAVYRSRSSASAPCPTGSAGRRRNPSSTRIVESGTMSQGAPNRGAFT